MLSREEINCQIYSILSDRQEDQLKPASYVESIAKFLCIRNGDESGIDAVAEEFRQSTNSFLRGRLSGDYLRNTKYLFVATSTLASRVAIESGLDTDISFILTEIFTQAVDKCTDVQSICTLHKQMITEYVLRCKESRGKFASRYTRLAMNYISKNIHTKISTSDVCEEIGTSKAQLNNVFHEDFGCTVSEYIMEYKLEIAQYYLVYYDYSIVEISSLLNFSSQSHFTQAFRKKFQKTPKQYRDECRQLLNPPPE